MSGETERKVIVGLFRAAAAGIVVAIILGIIAIANAATTDTDTFVAGVTNVSYTYDTTGAVSLTVGTGKAVRIKQILLGLSAVGGAGSLTATIHPGSFTAVNPVIFTEDMTAKKSTHEIYEGDFDLNEGATLVLSYPNANNRDYVLMVTWELLQ